MSVTFLPDPCPVTSRDEACLCSQDSPAFTSSEVPADAVEIRASLAKHARPGCPSCKGSGVESVTYPMTSDAEGQADTLNVANANAAILLTVLGLPVGELYGSCTLPEARRALMRARARKLDGYVREDEELRTPARMLRDVGGVARIVPGLRGVSSGLTVAHLGRYLDRWEALIAWAASVGATRIRWD